MILGAQLFVERPTGVVTAAGLGVDPDAQVDYTLGTGTELTAPNDLLVSPTFLAALGAAIGDTVMVAAGYDPQLRTYTGRQALVIRGIATFNYLPADRPVAALLLPTLQSMGGDATRDRISFAVARLQDGADAAVVSAALEASEPTVSVLSTSQALAAVEERLSYFRQLAFILASVSLVVGFLLVTTIVTVGVNERLGEIAVLRAIGTSKGGIVAQILAEGAVLGLTGALGGLVVGLITAEWLNSILSGFPGLPAEFDFFVFRARDAWTSLGLLALCGTLAGVLPAWRAASLPIARTLREDAVV
jgi:putative ABC transport system permease protein